MSEMMLVVTCSESTLRIKTKTELIGYFERKLTMRRQHIAAVIIQRAFRAHAARLYNYRC